jgi:hypothetical protein
LLGPKARDGVANKEAAMAQSTQEPVIETPELRGEGMPPHATYNRSEQLSRMTPERRATYERIMKLRSEIGPIDFDVSEAIQDLRQNG